MRKMINWQLKIDEQNISKIKFDLRSRDEIPKLLMGLQYIYCNTEIREQVSDILQGVIPEETDSKNGRPGTDLWKILILGTLRLNCDWDYDKVKEIADNHLKVREMMGHCRFEDSLYSLQTVKDNVSLFTPDIPDEINQIVVKAGHNPVKKNEEGLRGKCDSFVVETDVCFPIDIRLLYDSVRKMITLIAIICSEYGIGGWRQSHSNILKIRRLFNYVRCIRHSTSMDEKKKTERNGEIIRAHEEFISLAIEYLGRAKLTIEILNNINILNKNKLSEIVKYANHAERQIDQIGRRVIRGEKIPHSEKVFSIFEEHTEWICKGKTGVSQELGIKVCVIEDQYRFVLHHQVMKKETDEKVAVLMALEAKNRFEDMVSCSFDKGFYSKINKVELQKILGVVILPKKGKLSYEEKEMENSEEFVRLRHEHSAVESAISALENHGLDRCPDHGIERFERYVALAISGRNLQVLGNIIQQKEFERRKRIEKYNRTWDENRDFDRLAA
jgi:IS5 family transposase